MNVSPVSVIIPTYNRAELLKRALLSVADQTLKCAEVIVVDDGSTDATVKLLEKFSRGGKILLKVLKQENRGVAAARNMGIKNAEHDYIAFLDSDDHWHKEKLETQYLSFLQNPKYLISHTREKWLRRGIHLNQKKKHIPQYGDIFNQSLQLCSVGMSTVMVRSELFSKVGMFDESLRCCEDYDLWLRVSCRYPFHLIDRPLTVKEGGRKDQLSFLYRVGMDRMRIYCIKKLLDSGILEPGQITPALTELKRKCTVFGKGCIKHGKKELGEYYLKLAEIYLDDFNPVNGK